MGWKARDRIPLRARLFVPSRMAPRPTQTHLKWVLDFYPGLKRPMVGDDHPSPSSAGLG